MDENKHLGSTLNSFLENEDIISELKRRALIVTLGLQLSTQYDEMAERHELYAKYGIAAEAAQLFETELGTLLLCLEGIENGWHISPDGTAARNVLDSIDRKTLGQLLKALKKHTPLDDNIEEQFSSALEARNRLMHGFFEKHNFKIQTESGRAEMIAALNYLHGELFKAWQSAAKISGAFAELMQSPTSSPQ